MTVYDGFFWGIGFYGATLILAMILFVIGLIVTFGFYLRDKKKEQRKQDVAQQYSNHEDHY